MPSRAVDAHDRSCHIRRVLVGAPAVAVVGSAIGDVARGVAGVRDVRSRTAARRRFAEVTIAVDGRVDVATAHQIADAVEARLEDILVFHRVVVHIAPC